MTSHTLEHAAPAITGRLDRQQVPFRHSLLLRLTLALSALVLVMSAGLFFGIDYFVSSQFHDLRNERLNRMAIQIQQIVDQELHQLDSIARLLVNDTELRNNTYYHLYLEGEQIHPQAVVDRIVQAFDITSVSLWAPGGRLIAANSGRPVLPLYQRSGVGASIQWLGDSPWLVSIVPVMRSGNLLAHLQLARTLSELFQHHGFGPDSEYRVQVVDSGERLEDGIVVELSTATERPVFIQVAIPDIVGKALFEVKKLLPLILAGGAILIALSFILFLRWQLRPLMQLTQAVNAVGRGDFGISLTPSGSREVFELMSAYNSMTSDLAKLRRKEQQWRHEKQLSVIGQVAARVAHDINNPLTVIRNTVRLMQRRTPAGDTQAADDLALVHHHCERAIRIVENLLHYGRPVKVRLSRLDLVDFCSERATEWSKRSGATVRFEADHRPLWVDADPFQLEQLLENLLDNARQAAPDATITLTCGRRGSLIYLSIADGGPGFSDEARAHLFEPFFTTKDGGSGLGLANSLSIARAHGGTIEIGGQQRGEVILLLPGESERI